MAKRKEHVFANGIETKECSKCKEWLALECFSTDKSKWDGLHGYCKNCTNQKNKEIYRADPKKKYKKVLEYQIRTERIKKYKPYNPAYYSSEKSKAKKRARDINRRELQSNANHHIKITNEVVSRLLQKYDKRCAYCGADCSTDYEIDHKIPLSRGGNNDESNLAISCKRCNCSKHTKTDIEFCGHSV